MPSRITIHHHAKKATPLKHTWVISNDAAFAVILGRDWIQSFQKDHQTYCEERSEERVENDVEDDNLNCKGPNSQHLCKSRYKLLTVVAVVKYCPEFVKLESWF